MLGGLVMSGALPIYMPPEVDEELRVDHCVTPETVARTLEEHPDLTAVYLVSPTYYGVAADLAAIERIVHGAGKVLLVDEAWGPHFHFHPALPLSATAAGADLCINSTHKMLSSFSQCAMLHHKGERVAIDRLEAVLKMFLSTSPNLPMVASLDVARKQMATEGAALLSRTIELAKRRGRGSTKSRASTASVRRCRGETASSISTRRRSPYGQGAGLHGVRGLEILRRRYNIQVELADLFNVVALFTIGTTRDAAERLILAFEEMARDDRPIDMFAPSGILEGVCGAGLRLPAVPPMRMCPAKRSGRSGVREVSRVTGRICAETLTPYPPGIPVIAPGEEITQEIIDYLRLELKAGVRIQGPHDGELRVIRVVKE